MDGYEPVSVPIRDGLIKMRDLRDFVEVTLDTSEEASVVVLPDELQYSGVTP